MSKGRLHSSLFLAFNLKIGLKQLVTIVAYFCFLYPFYLIKMAIFSIEKINHGKGYHVFQLSEIFIHSSEQV